MVSAASLELMPLGGMPKDVRCRSGPRRWGHATTLILLKDWTGCVTTVVQVGEQPKHRAELRAFSQSVAVDLLTG